jgi:hypothetical protein
VEYGLKLGDESGERRDKRKSGIEKRFEISGFLSARQVSERMKRRSSARDETKFLPLFFS